MENPEQWQKVKQIVGSVLEKVPDQRAAYLDEACGSDRALRSEVESLVSAYESSHVLSEPSEETEVVRAGQELKSVGPYRLLRKLGEGGMGQVWLAEQVSPVHREVALKLIKAGMYDHSLLRRFQSERQSLAIMDHPAIAKIFDAGTTPEGQSYFIMEYVPGIPITDYCDEKKLKIRARLELFIQACEGVQHAHQKAIIHRDLKPENILVVEVDGKPMPRIIDFGLAKATTPQIAGEPLFTQVGSFVGTPGYLSPEQADPSGRDVDTRTDVYSLGVILYVLLTHFLPFDTEKWKKQPLDKALKQLREEDPPRPSAKVRLEKLSSSSSAAMRATEPRQLARLLRGDLDWITMKAIEKDRNRRYGTPSELAADVRRYLNHEPIVARPASTAYRLRRYVRRHRTGVSAAAAIAVLLIASGVVQAVELRRTTRERDRANRITDFMTSMFRVSDPSESRGNTITAREVLDKASKEMSMSLAKEPEIQAEMMYTMGNVYESLGLYPQAEELLRHAFEIQKQALGPRNRDTLASVGSLGWVLYEEHHLAEAEKLEREKLELEHSTLGPEDPDTLQAMNSLGMILRAEGRRTDAEKLLKETLTIRLRVLGPEHPDTLKTMNNLALVLDREGTYSQAEALYRRAFDVQRRILGVDHPNTLTTMSNVAWVLAEQGKDAEALKLAQETVDLRRRVLGPDSLATLQSMERVAGILMHMQQYDQAEGMLRQIRDSERRIEGPESAAAATTTYDLACIAARRGAHDQALSFLREATEHGLPPVVAVDMKMDPDLQSLHGDPRFDDLVAYARQRAASAQKQK